MKILILATATPNTASVVQKIIEIAPNKERKTIMTLCLLGTYENTEVQMPEGISSVISLPPVEKLAQQASHYALILEEYCKQKKIDIIVGYADKLCQQLIVMLSEKLQIACLTEVTKIEQRQSGMAFYRKVYDANLEAVFQGTMLLAITVARGKCKNEPRCISYLTKKINSPKVLPEWVHSSRCIRQQSKNALESAKILFVVGRGIGNLQNVERVRRLAEYFDGVVGATRAVVLNGWSPIESLIGQSGTITAPDLCVTFGVSGAGPFLVGVESAKTLIAINNDTSAAIFNVATYGIVDDCNNILSAMEQLEKEKTYG